MQQTAFRSRAARLGKFGAVGIINTLLDFIIFNACSKFLGLPIIAANVISTTISMIFSFTANRKLVFKDHNGSAARHAVAFYAVTAFGLYVIQTGIIHLLVTVYPVPLMMMVRIVRALGIHWFSDAFYLNNGAKAIGTVASLAWNYIMYRRVVFR